MERTRLKDIKVLFFAGVNDGIIPKHGGKAGLLSESDREFLDSRQVALAPTARESMYIQRFYLYLNLTKPSRCLYLSYAQSNAQGQAQSPAYLIALILRMYPKLVIQDNPKDEISQMQMAQQATEILLAGLRKDGEQQQNDGWRELFSWYLRSKEWKEQCLCWIQAAYEGAPESSIGKAAAVALYGKELENSATELERFAACAFAHFLQYVCAHSVQKRLSGLGKLRRELIHFKLHSGICVTVYIFIAVFGADDIVRHLHLFARCRLAVFKILAKALKRSQSLDHS